ncbi:MAG: SMC-Scp complex subunit ScpB [Thermotogota bacterium]|nr:SMC-Scp complex subunit ScpB [Thermotogota bacterium]
MNEDNLNKKAAIEALILASKRGVTPKKIAKILGMRLNQVMVLVDELTDDYKSKDHGVQLMSVEGKLRFYTKKDLQSYVDRLTKRPLVKITDTQMEVLAIVAVRGPVTRVDVELMRGKNSQAQLAELLKMSLVRRTKSKLPGNPYMYKVTSKFYDVFQIDDVSEIAEKLFQKKESEDESETSEISSEDDEPVQEESGQGD